MTTDTHTVELEREELAEIRPRELLPDDYDEEGFAGGGPCGEVGERVHSFTIKRRAVDTFVRGGPEDCPYDSKEAVVENTESGDPTRYKCLYGEEELTGPPGEVYWCSYIPEQCPFCGEEIDRAIGTILDHLGLDYGVTHCPKCYRIYGTY